MWNHFLKSGSHLTENITLCWLLINTVKTVLTSACPLSIRGEVTCFKTEVLYTHRDTHTHTQNRPSHDTASACLCDYLRHHPLPPFYNLLFSRQCQGYKGQDWINSLRRWCQGRDTWNEKMKGEGCTARQECMLGPISLKRGKCNKM